eukprot:4613284-Pyramimonas_sp.AAC.1
MVTPNCCCPVTAVAQSVACWLKADTSTYLGQLYVSWVATAESTINDHHQQAHLGSSRAQGPEFRVVAVREVLTKRATALRDTSSP